MKSESKSTLTFLQSSTLQKQNTKIACYIPSAPRSGAISIFEVIEAAETAAEAATAAPAAATSQDN